MPIREDSIDILGFYATDERKNIYAVLAVEIAPHASNFALSIDRSQLP
jgi:hypothetical protein